MQQTMSNWEAICIDDGSTDGSAAILDAYAAKDSRIKVIHKQNGGVSSARNRGIEESTAPYISMVDSDDFLAPDALEKLLEAAQKDDCDLVCCTMKKIYSNGHTETEQSRFAAGIHDAAPSDIYRFAMRSPCCKLYKRDIIEREKIRFPLNVPICEDDVFVVTYWFYVKRFYMLNEPLYSYLQSESSVLKKLGNGELAYESYAATLRVPILIYNNIVSNIQNDPDRRKWSHILLRSQFNILEWMCECAKDKTKEKRLRKQAEEYIAVLSSAMPLWLAWKERIRVRLGRKIKIFLISIRKK